MEAITLELNEVEAKETLTEAELEAATGISLELAEGWKSEKGDEEAEAIRKGELNEWLNNPENWA